MNLDLSIRRDANTSDERKTTKNTKGTKKTFWLSPSAVRMNDLRHLGSLFTINTLPCRRGPTSMTGPTRVHIELGIG